ncbi:hypothetical protein J2T56_002177 [Natronobacillus azotifigens]|uniref:YhcN/YlaJ family sporulation lipoprotein n=1 Tax=Natronobacillus azotifigens TaxID=472978 RepID=A0A9J6RE55_9BACI|nr:YhcN/YlaJ family sporulation lipoprotein [Natronobacillus azotifigens]MCZ0703944.1 YhcN/YlaJ family sporulation lipoprotein [Natronobacillus azotifigens]
MKNKILIRLLAISLVIITLAACAGVGLTLDEEPINPIQVRQMNYAGYEQEAINRHVLDKFDSIIEVTSVMNKDEILLAIKASTFEQFNEQQIEEKVKDELKNFDPDLKSTVSSDQKFFLEIDRLKYHIRDQNLNQAEFDVQFQKVKEIVTPRN